MHAKSKPKSTKLGRIEGALDPTDWILVKEVQQDARLSWAELGRRSELSAPAAAERLRRLEDSGVIAGYHARINPESLGLRLTVFIDITVRRVDYPRFQEEIEKLPWVLECHHVAGRASFLLKAVAPDTEGLELLIGHLSRFGDTNTSLVLSTSLARREFRNE